VVSMVSQSVVVWHEMNLEILTDNVLPISSREFSKKLIFNCSVRDNYMHMQLCMYTLRNLFFITARTFVMLKLIRVISFLVVLLLLFALYPAAFAFCHIPTVKSNNVL